MKKLIWCLIGILMMFVGVTCTSCTHKSGHAPKRVDSTMVTEVVYDYFNPQFNDVDGIIEYQTAIKAEQVEDSIFAHMSSDVLNRVATVLYNKGYMPLDKTNVVREYLKNQDIYDNLKEKLPAEPVIPMQTSDSAGNDEYTLDYRPIDTIINGESLTILRKERHHE